MSRVSSALAPRCVAVIGGGPAGLMAAETLAAGGARVDLYDAMPSVGRKFLMAGRGGLNLTHSEPMAPFLARYGARRDDLAPWLARFDPQALRAWAHELGVATFVGTSGRVFPTDMKAAPLLRAWLSRLRRPEGEGSAPVGFHMRHRWLGWAEDGRTLRFETPRDHMLAAQHQTGALAQHRAQQKRRRPEQSGPIHGVRQRVGEVAVRDRVGGGQVEGSLGALVGQQKNQGVDVIIDVNPAHPLLAIAEHG